MHLIVNWKENVNNQLSIIDYKDRLEENFFEEQWLKKLYNKIINSNIKNKESLIKYLDDFNLTKKAFKSSIKDFENDSNNILKKYDICKITNDEKHLTFEIIKKDMTITMNLEEVFCIDNESIKNRTDAIKKSEEWINNGLVKFDFDIRSKDNMILYSANEITGIDEENQYVKNILIELEKDYNILKDYNEQTIAFKEYIKKREIVPEILSRSNGTDSLLKEPTDYAIAAFSTILIEKNMLKLNPINYEKRYKLK